MSQAHAWFKMTQPTRSTTRELKIATDSKATTKEDHQDSTKGEIHTGLKLVDENPKTT